MSSRRVVRRAVSLDLVLPNDRSLLRVNPSDPGSPIVVPLGWMNKAQLVDFDLQEGSQRLSLVRSALNDLVAAQLQRHIAVLDGIPERAAEAALPHLRRIAGFDLDDARDAFAELFGEGIGAPKLAREIRDSDVARETALRLRDAYLMLVELPEDGRRRLVRFATDQRLADQTMTLEHRLALTPNRILLEVPGAGQAASYHVEVSVPDGCTVVDAVPIDATAVDALDRETTFLWSRAARYIRPVDSSKDASLELVVAPDRSLFFGPAAVLSAVTALVLLIGAIVAASGTQPETAAGTVLLSGLSVVTGLVLRRDEGRLTAELHAAARIVLTLVALCAIGAAATLVFGAGGRTLATIWACWCFAVTVCTLILAAAFLKIGQAEDHNYR